MSTASFTPSQSAPNEAAARGRTHTCRLDPDEARAALALAAECHARFARTDDPRFLEQVTVLSHELPRAARELAGRSRLDDRKHAVVISGNAVDEDTLEPTPLHWRDAETDGSAVHGFLLALYGSLFGDGISWASQQDGRLITDVLPTPGAEQSLVSSCSERELGWHTEDAFSPYRADYVGLYCLRAPEPTPTTLSFVDRGLLPDDVAGLLGEPRFEILPDSSHDPAEFDAPAPHDPAVHTGANDGFDLVLGMEPTPPRVAVLDGAADAPVLRIDRDFVRASRGDAAGARALRWLIDNLDANIYELTLAPGDVCFIDNRNVVHGRRSFTPRFDGTDRWLKRLNLVTDLRRTRPGRRTSDTRVIG